MGSDGATELVTITELAAMAAMMVAAGPRRYRNAQSLYVAIDAGHAAPSVKLASSPYQSSLSVLSSRTVFSRRGQMIRT